jgi:tetratricopeptide (TPR) repeat protein
MLEDTAATANENRTDAMFALVLVYNREKRYEDALRILGELRRLHPRNRLILLEAGATALRGERFRDAVSLLSEGLALVPTDEVRRIPGEVGLWRYKRGAAYARLAQPDQAVSDLTAAATAAAQKWVHGRARVELARLALARGDRAAAANDARQARALCEEGNDAPCSNDAKKLLRMADGR